MITSAGAIACFGASVAMIMGRRAAGVGAGPLDAGYDLSRWLTADGKPIPSAAPIAQDIEFVRRLYPAAR